MSAYSDELLEEIVRQHKITNRLLAHIAEKEGSEVAWKILEDVTASVDGLYD